MTISVDEQALRKMVEAPASYDVTPSIDAAKLIVTEELTGQSYTSDRFNLIATFLAAHFLVLAVEKGGLKREKVLEGDEYYVTPTGEGFSSTRFGQQALVLDTSGTLVNISKGANKTKAVLRLV